MSNTNKNGGVKKVSVIFLILLLIAPTIVGFVSYHLVKNTSISQKSVSQMALTDLAGTQYTFERSTNDLDITDITTNPIRFFLQLNANATEVPALPEPLSGTECFKAVYTSYGRQVDYRYYFTGSAEYCYFTDDSNRTFKVSNEYATAFLRSEYAMSIYEDAKLPVMTLASGEVIEPAALQWKYKTDDGLETNYSKTAEEIDAAVHSVSGALEFSFDVVPDTVEVTVVRDGAEIFKGLYDELATLDLDVGAEFAVTVEAEWVENSERGYSGNATYSFNATYLDKPVFYLGETSVEVGDFVLLTAKNVSNASTITFKSEPELAYSPIFFQDGAFYRAFIPISIYAEHPDSYLLTCSADGVSQEITMNVSPRRQKSSSSSETLGDFKTILSDVFTTQTGTRYFSGIFTDPFEKEKTARVGFYNILSTEKVHEGYDYPADDGEKICAVNNGVVLFAGNVDNCGNVVVVDHGFGLMTSYVLLDSVTVKAGDMVSTGSELGTAGDANHVHLELTVFGTPVDIDTAWKYGVITND